VMWDEQICQDRSYPLYNMQPLFREILVTPSVMFSSDLMVLLRKVVKLLLHIDCLTMWWRW